MKIKFSLSILFLTLVALVASIIPASAGNRGTTPPPPPPPTTEPVTSHL